MKKNTMIRANLLVLAAILFVQTAAFAQKTSQSAEWIRVGSDDGEFSIEVPAEHAFFTDKDGFSVTDNMTDYALAEVNMLNAFYEKTALSFESYKADKRALNSIRERDAGRGGRFSDVRRGDFAVKQLVAETDKFYMIRQYFNSKNRIYILTAIARNGETPAMRRFLDSLVFAPPKSGKTAGDSGGKTILFSALKTVQINVEENAEPYKKPVAATAAPAENEKTLPLVISLKPIPSYTESARKKGETGVIQMRLTFSREGYVSKVGVIKNLKFGLVRQAFFAALRIKFLPAEADEKPLTIAKVLEYSFDIY